MDGSFDETKFSDDALAFLDELNKEPLMEMIKEDIKGVMRGHDSRNLDEASLKNLVDAIRESLEDNINMIETAIFHPEELDETSSALVYDTMLALGFKSFESLLNAISDEYALFNKDPYRYIRVNFHDEALFERKE